MKWVRIWFSSIHSRIGGSGQKPRRPTCTKFFPGTAPDSMSRRIGVPWPASAPRMSGAVSACASKWMMPTLP